MHGKTHPQRRGRLVGGKAPGRKPDRTAQLDRLARLGLPEGPSTSRAFTTRGKSRPLETQGDFGSDR